MSPLYQSVQMERTVLPPVECFEQLKNVLLQLSLFSVSGNDLEFRYCCLLFSFDNFKGIQQRKSER